MEQVYNLPHMTPHGFRHTFISDSLNAGVNQFSLKGIVGHSPVSNVTEHTYGHVNAQAQKSVFEMVEPARRGWYTLEKKKSTRRRKLVLKPCYNAEGGT